MGTRSYHAMRDSVVHTSPGRMWRSRRLSTSWCPRKHVHPSRTHVQIVAHVRVTEQVDNPCNHTHQYQTCGACFRAVCMCADSSCGHDQHAACGRAGTPVPSSGSDGTVSRTSSALKRLAIPALTDICRDRHALQITRLIERRSRSKNGFDMRAYRLRLQEAWKRYTWG